MKLKKKRYAIALVLVLGASAAYIGLPSRESGVAKSDGVTQTICEIPGGIARGVSGDGDLLIRNQGAITVFEDSNTRLEVPTANCILLTEKN